MTTITMGSRAIFFNFVLSAVVALLFLAVPSFAKGEDVVAELTKEQMIEEILTASAEDASVMFGFVVSQQVKQFGFHLEGDLLNKMLALFMEYWEEEVVDEVRRLYKTLTVEQIRLLYEISQDPQIRAINSHAAAWLMHPDRQQELQLKFARLLLEETY